MKTRHENKGLRKLCEHPRRAWAKCDHAWYFSFKWMGTHYRFSLDKHLDKHIDSKSDAEDEAAKIRIAIKAGKFGQTAPRQDMTLRQLADEYLERDVDVRHAATRLAYVYALNTICRTVVRSPTGGDKALGGWRVADIVKDTCERLREVRLKDGTGIVGVNRSLRSLRALFNWGIGAGHVESTPFKRQGVVVVTLDKESKRSRRLQDGEDAALMAACGAYLRAVVIAAIETGMRKGEILSLQWHQVEGMRIDASTTPPTITWAPKAELFLPKTKTKTKRDRKIPISTRLKSILDMRRLDPVGQPHALDAFVFGSEIGTRVTTFKRAWLTAVLKSHSVTPVYTKGANLAPVSRATLKAIDLHFHDLRREAGSRWMDAGVPIATIQRWLGHENVSQTSTYLAGSAEAEHAAMAKFEAHQAALQRLATEARTGGKQRLQTATSGKGKLNKTAVGRDTPIM